MGFIELIVFAALIDQITSDCTSSQGQFHRNIYSQSASITEAKCCALCASDDLCLKWSYFVANKICYFHNAVGEIPTATSAFVWALKSEGTADTTKAVTDPATEQGASHVGSTEPVQPTQEAVQSHIDPGTNEATNAACKDFDIVTAIPKIFKTRIEFGGQGNVESCAISCISDTECRCMAFQQLNGTCGLSAASFDPASFVTGTPFTGYCKN